MILIDLFVFQGQL